MTPTTPAPLLRQEGATLRLIDTHCHLQMPDYDGDRAEMIQRSLDAGTGMIAIGTTLIDSIAGVRLAEKYHDQPIWAAIGIHPTDEQIDDVRVDDLAALLPNTKIVGIGECGLDYFHVPDPEDQQVQNDLFEQQILLAQQVSLPLIIHCRDANGVYVAYDDVLALLTRHSMKNFVMHCFSGDETYAEKFLDLGGMLSFTGIVTFPKSEIMQRVVKQIPIDRMMIETDAPFLAPVPHRGQRNEPFYVAEVAKKIAEVRGVSVEEIARVTTENAQRFFRLP